MTKQIARMHIMEKSNINLMERYLLLLDRFVDKLTQSGFEEKEIIENAYLFCAGFYIKYQSGIEKNDLLQQGGCFNLSATFIL